MGTWEDIIATVFGPQDPEEKKHTLILFSNKTL